MGVGSTSESGGGAATQTRTAPSHKPVSPRAWNVVLLDDNDHSYPYVALLLKQVFGHDPKVGWEIARTVDKHGRAVCMTTHLELAELKQEQIHAFGPDPLIASCAGSMSAIIEPAEGDDGADPRGPRA